jgi:inositol transport system ATP-binding protein
VSYDSDVLIMDEPTSALTEHEVSHLFRIIRELRAAGKGIIYITHKMNELFEIADEFSVFRDGKYIATCASSDVTRDDIIRMMVGREITQMFPKETVPIGEVVLSVQNLTLDGVFHDVSFDIRAGEILGLAGLVGSGRSNVAETLFGVTPASSGSITIRGQQMVIDQPAKAMAAGMAFLTEDRKDTGCFLCLDIQDNMELAVLNSRYVNKLGFVQSGQLAKDCIDMSRRLRVKTPHMQETIQNLSGGNQQKVLLARWLEAKPKVMILDEPTRGVDIGAKAEIYRIIDQLAQNGVAVLVISSELPEIMGICDRILVMREGHIEGEVGGTSGVPVTQEAIMALATGVQL